MPYSNGPRNVVSCVTDKHSTYPQTEKECQRHLQPKTLLRFNALIRGNAMGSQMSSQRTIVKIGLAVMHDSRLLLVRKKGGRSFILPGGKPEAGEDDRQALVREINEELGCAIDPETLVFFGSFSDTAADLQDTTVTVKLYGAKLVGTPAPRSEIECVTWFAPDLDECVTLAPSIQNQILPFLRSSGKLAHAN